MKAENVAAVRLSGIILESFSPGPPHWGGFLGFVNPERSRHPDDPRVGLTATNMEIIKLPDGTWAIKQLYYEF